MLDHKTLEPDGEATGCNPVEVGSTPTSVSDRSTAGSDYIFLEGNPLFGGGGTDCSVPIHKVTTEHRNWRFVGAVLVYDTMS